MLKKILFIIYIIAFIVIAYYVATFFYDRETENISTPIDRAKSRIEKVINNENTEEKSEHSSPIIKEDDFTNENSKEEIIVIDSEPAAYVITRQQCDDECADIDDRDEKNYCREFCGLTGNLAEDVSCDNLSSLQRDYCVRDKAVQEQDLKKCSEIADSGIREQCQNRIQEDIIDEIM